jgi:hypothetical protein
MVHTRRDFPTRFLKLGKKSILKLVSPTAVLHVHVHAYADADAGCLHAQFFSCWNLALHAYADAAVSRSILQLESSVTSVSSLHFRTAPGAQVLKHPGALSEDFLPVAY